MNTFVKISHFVRRSKEFGRQSTTLLVGQVIATCLTTITSVIVARNLGPSGKGALGVALVFSSSLVTFSGFGLDTASPYFLAKDTFLRDVVYATNWAIYKVRVLLILCSGALAISVLGDSTFKNSSPSLLLVGMLLSVSISAFAFLNWYPLGWGELTRYSINLLSPVLVSLLGVNVILLLTHNIDAFKLILIDIAAYSIGATILFWQVRQRRFARSKPSFNYFKKFIRYGFPAYGAQVLTFANNRLLWLLIAAESGNTQLGIYILAQGLIEQLGLLIHPVATVMFTRVLHMSLLDVRKKTLVVFSTVFSLSVGLVILLFFSISPIFKLLYGIKFEDSIYIAKFLLPILALDASSRVLNAALQGLGKTGAYFLVIALSAISGIVSAFLLYPHFQVIGVVLSSLLSSTVSFGLSFYLFMRCSRKQIS